MRIVTLAERGQALFETVLFLPLFLLSLFGIIYAVQVAVQSERVQLAVRYSGLISQQVSPYLSYSLFAMYSQLGKTAVPTQVCVQPLTSILSDGAPYTSSQTTTASQPFWVPLASSSPTCNGATASGSAFSPIVGSPAGSMFTQDVVVSHTIPGVTSQIAVPTFLQNVLGPITSAPANGNFFKGIGEDVLVTCFPVLNTTLVVALNPLGDASTSASLPTALGSTVTASPISANSNCTTSN